MHVTTTMMTCCLRSPPHPATKRMLSPVRQQPQPPPRANKQEHTSTWTASCEHEPTRQASTVEPRLRERAELQANACSKTGATSPKKRAASQHIAMHMIMMTSYRQEAAGKTTTAKAQKRHNSRRRRARHGERNRKPCDAAGQNDRSCSATCGGYPCLRRRGGGRWSSHVIVKLHSKHTERKKQTSTLQ